LPPKPNPPYDKIIPDSVWRFIPALAAHTMSNRTLWNWTIAISAVLAILGVVVARVLEALLPADTINIVVVVFFTICVVAMGGLIALYTLRRR